MEKYMKDKNIINYSVYSGANEAAILSNVMYFDLSKFNKSVDEVNTFKDVLSDLRENINNYVEDQGDKALPKYLSAIEAYSKEHPEILDYKISNVSTLTRDILGLED